MINVLDKKTIDQIAAGEVVERPSSIVKELVENSVDAGAKAVTIEIKDGGVSFIRITDNGSGIEKEDVRTAFFRHATSKIKSSEDLMSIKSLGFRGEALSSIASIAKVELITKTADAFTGTRYVIEGGEEISFEECGCPDGTTFIIKDVFFNTPARRKFLKSATTETGYISELVEKLSLSHPEVSFKLIASGKVILHTSGNGKLQDVVLELYGLDTAKALLSLDVCDEENGLYLSGVICKPYVSRGNRAYEGTFVNGRFVRSKILMNAVEDGYKGYMMGHCFPVCALFLICPTDFVDVNVHPSKLELKFSDNEAVYNLCLKAVRDTLSGKNMIVKAEPEDDRAHSEIVKEKKDELNKIHIPEPFEVRKPTFIDSPVQKKTEFVVKEKTEEFSQCKESGHASDILQEKLIKEESDVSEYTNESSKPINIEITENITEEKPVKEQIIITEAAQEELPLDLYRDKKKEFRIVGEVFSTYWIIEMDNTMFIIDQHAAHEKVLFERTMKKLREKSEFMSQSLMPASLLSLSIREAEALKKNIEQFERLGFEVSEFGGNEFRVTGVPAELVDVDLDDLFKEVLNSLLNERESTKPDVLLERIATISCKAAVKGNNRISEKEAEKLISDMFELEDPYHCPHGRPTTISMTKSELEKKFKRLI